MGQDAWQELEHSSRGWTVLKSLCFCIPGKTRGRPRAPQQQEVRSRFLPANLEVWTLQTCHRALSLTKDAQVKYILSHFLEVACWRDNLSTTTLHGFSNKGSDLYKKRWGQKNLYIIGSPPTLKNGELPMQQVFISKIDFYLLCLGVLHACVSLHQYMQYPKRPQGGIGISVTGLKYSSQLPRRCWEPN